MTVEAEVSVVGPQPRDTWGLQLLDEEGPSPTAFRGSTAPERRDTPRPCQVPSLPPFFPARRRRLLQGSARAL